MAAPLEWIQYETLREMLRFGLNMANMARLYTDTDTAARATGYAYKALKDYQRFRSGLTLRLPQHNELSSMAIDLSTQLLSLGLDPTKLL